jgi:Zn-dependent peptidase ImmA (M78 family)/DNA-binding XRE family transcriptional regulator
MPIGTPGFSGQRLREAREARGLSAISLAELLGVHRQSISQYEHDQSSPSRDRLYEIAARLNVPARFFLQPPRIFNPITVYYRSQSAAGKGERSKAEQRLRWFGDIADYLAGFVEFPPVFFPRADFGPGPLSRETIEQAASETRTFWGMGTGPIGSVVGFLEVHGAIATRGIVETETIDAFSARFPGDRPYLFLGADKDSASRSRFDAAHELGHTVLHRERRVTNKTERAQAEQEAQWFASAFLLPADSFAADLHSLTLDAMVLTKEHWGVSVGAMIHRLADLGITTEQESRRLWMARAKRGWHRREPLDDEQPVEQPQVVRRALELIIHEGVRSKEQVLGDLPFQAADIESLAGLPAGYFTDAAPPVRLLDRSSRRVARESNGEQAEIVPFPSHDPGPIA